MSNKSLRSRLLFALALLPLLAPMRAQAVDLETTLKSQLALEALKADTGLSQSSSARQGVTKITSANVDGTETDYVDMILAHEKLGPIHLFIRGPHGFLRRGPETALKTLFLASGFFTGKAAVRLVPNDPELVVVGFQYAYTIEDLQKDPGKIFELVRRTPAQIAASLQWVSKQPWLQYEGLIAMGVSLGGLFLPVSLHIAESLGTDVHGTILAFTGAHLPPVLDQLLKGQVPHDVLDVGIRLLNNLTSLHDPKLHVPFLQGSFLTIRADNDQIFPRESSQLLEDLLPGPATNVVVHGPHIDVDQPEVILQTQLAVKTWMATDF